MTHTTTHNYLQSQLGGYGDFMIHGGNPGTTSYTMPYTPVNTRVAVDVSRNKDYVAGTTFTEPTLSYRVIYDIRDAKEMAKKMAYVPQHEIKVSGVKVFDMVLTGRKPYIQWKPSESDFLSKLINQSI